MNEGTDIQKVNREIAQKFLKIEAGLDYCASVKELFENLLIQLQKEFIIPFVWISIIKRDNLIGMIQALSSSQLLCERLNVIDDSTFLNLVANGTKPLLVNKDLKPFYKLLPPNTKYFFKSLALVPITLNDTIIGSINHGDFTYNRYHPGMDTSLLQNLASNFSSRLSSLAAVETENTE